MKLLQVCITDFVIIIMGLKFFIESGKDSNRAMVYKFLFEANNNSAY